MSQDWGDAVEPASIRLTFEYDGTEFELKKASRVAMRAPKADQPRDADQGTLIGSQIELRDSDGEVVYRRTVHQIVPDEVELHVGGEEEFTHVPLGEASGLSHVVIPVLEEAETVVLRERRPPSDEQEEPTEITHAEISLDDIDEERFDQSDVK